MSNIIIIRGYAVRVQINLIALDQNTNTEYPFDLTDRTVTSLTKPSVHSCKAYAFDVEVIDALNGIIELRMAPALTETIDSNELVFDVRVTDNNDPDWSFRAMNGTIIVQDQITP